MFCFSVRKETTKPVKPPKIQALISEIVNDGVPAVPPTMREDVPTPPQLKDCGIATTVISSRIIRVDVEVNAEAEEKLSVFRIG